MKAFIFAAAFLLFSSVISAHTLQTGDPLLSFGIVKQVENTCNKYGIKNKEQLCNVFSYNSLRSFQNVCDDADSLTSFCQYFTIQDVPLLPQLGCYMFFRKFFCDPIFKTQDKTHDGIVANNLTPYHENWSEVREQFSPLQKKIAVACDGMLDVAASIKPEFIPESDGESLCANLKSDYIEICRETTTIPCSELNIIAGRVCRAVVEHVFCK